MNPVVHFEMPYDNRQRMAAFYQSAFGWQTQMLGEEMGHYVVAHTTETVNGMVQTPGTINGGFYPRKPEWPAQHPSVEPMEIPGIGQYVSFMDTEGNRVSMLQPLTRPA